MQEVASATGGIYVRAGNSADASDKILEEIGKLQKGEVMKQNYSEYDDQFQLLAIFAIVLLIADVIISEKKNAVLNRITSYNVCYTKLLRTSCFAQKYKRFCQICCCETS